MSDSVPSKFLSDSSLSREREYPSSSSSSRGKFLTPLGNGVEGEKEGRGGITLSLAIQNYYGISHLATDSINELKLFNRHKDIIHEFEIQKAFTYSGICFILGRDEKDKTVKKLMRLLVARKLLLIYPWKGTAKRTFGVKIYYTPDATQSDIDRILYEYEVEDELRKSQEDRGSKKKTPEEVVQYTQRVKELSKKAAMEELKHQESMIDSKIEERIGELVAKWDTPYCPLCTTYTPPRKLNPAGLDSAKRAHLRTHDLEVKI